MVTIATLFAKVDAASAYPAKPLTASRPNPAAAA